MSKILIIFGAEGDMGKIATLHLLQHDYDKVYLVNRKFQFFKGNDRITLIEAGDLLEEESVKQVFGKISFNPDDELFLFSTIGGFSGGKSIAETDYTVWQKMITLNLHISFLLAKHFSLAVQSCKGGSIVFTSALAAMENGENNSAYSVSKNALNFLVKNLALEGKKYNLSANVISPYVIDTEANREWVKDTSILTSPVQIAETVHNLFGGYRFLSGGNITLPGTIGGI